MSDTSALFTPTPIGALHLRNRVVMAPMTRRFADDNRVPTEDMRAYYARRAHHGVGLIITEGTLIDPSHAPPPPKEGAPGRVPGIYNDRQADGWDRVTSAVHEEGGAIALQLWHCGRLGGVYALGPSGWKSPDGAYACRAMSKDDIARTIDEYAQAARIARDSEFDAVEIHGAHGYLLHSFLDPSINTRTDRYGGSFENRIRFPIEVTRAVRGALVDGFPIIYRFSQWAVDDYARIVLNDANEVERFTKALVEAGADALHPSTRDCTAPAFHGSDDPPETLAGITKRATGAHVIAVGRITTSQTFGDDRPLEPTDPAPAIELIERGEADLLAVGRALIANPDWCEKVRAGKWDELRAFDTGMLGRLA